MTDPIKQRLGRIHLIGASVLVLALVLAGLLAALPMYRDGRASIAKSQTLRQQLSELDGLSRTLQQVETDLQATKARLAATEQRLPTSNDMPQFMGELSRVAEEAGLTLSGTTPKAAQPAGDYRVLPVEITGEGTFKQCYDFLAGLRRMQRLTRLDNAVVESEQKTTEGAKPGDKTCKIKVCIATFMAR